MLDSTSMLSCVHSEATGLLQSRSRLKSPFGDERKGAGHEGQAARSVRRFDRAGGIELVASNASVTSAFGLRMTIFRVVERRYSSFQVEPSPSP